MAKHSPLKTAASFIFILVLVVGLSTVSNRIWGGRPEASPKPRELVIEPGMTIARFGQVNELPDPVLKEIFGLENEADLQKELKAYGSTGQIAAMVKGKLALAAEHAGKNWIKIPVKFGLWFAFLASVFILMAKRRVTPGLRNGVLFASFMLFGVALGADPSPMGTVKDAIHLYATSQVIFPPRLIALAVFLAIVLLANKYICAWGCQAGTLQDLLFRLNRTDQAKAVIGRQIKPPFALTNTVRCAFFLLFTLAAFSSGIDIIDPIDPFKIYKPAYLGLSGALFAGLLSLACLFVYRPWCHLFCPFGLVGWLMEKTSLVRISVDYESCIACGKCAAACPSTVMGAILKQDRKTIPDCFACYTCREVCPTDAIRFSTRKRTLPPTGHFGKSQQ